MVFVSASTDPRRGLGEGLRSLPCPPMVPIPALVEALITDPLNSLVAIVPLAGQARRKLLRRSAKDFHQAALAIHLHWAASDMGTDGPWVWANGNPHANAFTTLAVGPRRGVEPPATTYDLSDADDEHPAPWHWDLLRCLGSLGVWWRGHQSALRPLAATALNRYREVMLRAADGDADHGGRIFVQDLPAQVVTVLEQDGEPASEARWHRQHLVRGRSPRFRRDAAQFDDPSAVAMLERVNQWLSARDTTLRAIDAVRCAPNGMSAYDHPRFLVLGRDTAALRCLEISPRRASEWARVLPAYPVGQPMAQPATFTVPIGKDPWHQVMTNGDGSYLIRTRCHTRHPINLARGSTADRHHLVKLWATLLANAHLRGLSCLGADVAATAEAIATDVVIRRDAIASLCAELPQRNRQAWTAYCSSARLIRSSR